MIFNHRCFAIYSFHFFLRLWMHTRMHARMESGRQAHHVSEVNIHAKKVYFIIERNEEQQQQPTINTIHIRAQWGTIGAAAGFVVVSYNNTISLHIAYYTLVSVFVNIVIAVAVVSSTYATTIRVSFKANVICSEWVSWFFFLLVLFSRALTSKPLRRIT